MVLLGGKPGNLGVSAQLGWLWAAGVSLGAVILSKLICLLKRER